MKNQAKVGFGFFAVIAVFFATPALADLRIVGSSTVFPFSTAVAETYGRGWFRDTPVVESTGTGGGMKLFCSDNSDTAPDITNASRRIKESEYQLCQSNNIQLLETKIGYDGVVLANAKTAQDFSLTLQQIYLALAAQVPANRRCDRANCRMVRNPYRLWSDISPRLPRTRIEVLGPPPTSGTRDAFLELVMDEGAKTFAGLADMRRANKNRFKGLARQLREDGAWIDAGENDNLIVQKLVANPNALGVFGYSFLEENADKVQGSRINNVRPEFDLIADGSYPVARSLFVYMRLGGARENDARSFMDEFLGDRAMSEERGYLIDRGLIPLSAEELEAERTKIETLTPFKM